MPAREQSPVAEILSSHNERGRKLSMRLGQLGMLVFLAFNSWVELRYGRLVRSAQELVGAIEPASTSRPPPAHTPVQVVGRFRREDAKPLRRGDRKRLRPGPYIYLDREKQRPPYESARSERHSSRLTAAKLEGLAADRVIDDLVAARAPSLLTLRDADVLATSARIQGAWLYVSEGSPKEARYRYRVLPDEDYSVLGRQTDGQLAPLFPKAPAGERYVSARGRHSPAALLGRYAEAQLFVLWSLRGLGVAWLAFCAALFFVPFRGRFLRQEALAAYARVLPLASALLLAAASSWFYALRTGPIMALAQCAVVLVATQWFARENFSAS